MASERDPPTARRRRPTSGGRAATSTPCASRSSGGSPARLTDATDVVIPELGTTSATGMSSETLLFTATWAEGGRHRVRTARGPGRARPRRRAGVPDLRHDQAVRGHPGRGQRSDVPCRPSCGTSPTHASSGRPSSSWSASTGVVPPDIMPYPMGDNWLFDASPSDQRRVQDATVDVLARLHAIDDPTATFAFLEFPEAGDTHLRRHVAHACAWYEYAARGGQRSPLVERGFRWLDDHWPRHEGPHGAGLGRLAHRQRDVPRLPPGRGARLGDGRARTPRGRPRLADLRAPRLPGDGDDLGPARACPTSCSPTTSPPPTRRPVGHAPRDLDWYIAYAAVQWGVVGLITGLRSVHFGERELPDDIDDLLYNRGSLEPIVG